MDDDHGRTIVGLSAALLTELALQCAPNVSPRTVAAIVKTESGGNPIALNVNGARQPRRPATADSAIITARRYVARGYSVDLGLGQINSRNMRALGLTWDTVLDPCVNLAALGTILTQNYVSAVPGRDAQAALRVALSMYNTGNMSRGFRNGYVSKVVANAGYALGATGRDKNQPSKSNVLSDHLTAGPGPTAAVTRMISSKPPKWSVFERAAYDRRQADLKIERGAALWSN